jgi:hypothetical protein
MCHLTHGDGRVDVHEQSMQNAKLQNTEQSRFVVKVELKVACIGDLMFIFIVSLYRSLRRKWLQGRRNLR